MLLKDTTQKPWSSILLSRNGEDGSNEPPRRRKRAYAVPASELFEDFLCIHLVFGLTRIQVHAIIPASPRGDIRGACDISRTAEAGEADEAV